MFVQKALIKKINEAYFRNYQDTNFKPISGNETEEEIFSLTEIADKIDVELFNMTSDYFEEVYGKAQNHTPLSEETIALKRQEISASNRVVFQTCNLSDESHELMNILVTDFEEDTYIVGGFVRDAIAQRESKDVDLCTSIPYSKLQEVFEGKGWETKDTGKNFLVLNVIHPETKETFEIAALRKDKDNEGAEVGTIEEDAQRRDFVNSCIYFSLKEEKLIDPSGEAINDCKNNKLRFMGKAKDRIIEDPLRVLRAYKFIQRGWEADPKTLRAVRENFEFAIKNVAPMRVQKEIENMIGL